MKQETMGWHWHQLGYVQIIYTSFKTGNDASTSSLSFSGRLLFFDAQPTASKH